MADGVSTNKRVDALNGLIDNAAEVPCHRERSKLPMLDWLVKDAAQVFTKFGYESEEMRKLLNSAIKLAAASDPIDKSRIINCLSEKTGINVQTLKNQVKEIQQKTSDDRENTVQAQLDGIAIRYPQYREICELEGAPFHIGAGDSIQINQLFFVRMFFVDHMVVYEPSEDKVYIYGEPTGLWIPMSENAVKAMFSRDFHAFVGGHPLADKLLALRNDGFLGCCVRLLKGLAEKINAFLRPPGLHVLHLNNGMLVIDPSGSLQLHAYSPDFMSRNMIPFSYNPEAQCPRFIYELLEPYLSQEDIDLIQKYFGCVLLGGNIIQCFLILSGTPGGGKGTLCEIIELVIGQDNVAELRTSHLSERFEISAYAGKILLAGKDVPGDFLQHKSASVIKKLVGHDQMSGEMKGANQRTRLRGEYPIIINCNSRLRVRLDGDVDAWRRRLLMVEYKLHAVGKPIPNFASQLVQEEGEGILAWGIEGAIKLLKDIEDHGRILLTEAHSARVDALLLESDSIRVFVRVRLCRGNGDVTSAELVTSYVDFCNDKGWNALASKLAENQLPDIMLNEFGVHKANDVKRNERSQRGYHGIVFKPVGGQ